MVADGGERMARRLYLAMIACVLLLPSAAAAQTTLPTANDGVLGELRTRTIAASSQYYLRYRLTENRSYYAACWGPFQTDTGQKCTTDWRNAADASVSDGDNREPFISDNGDGDTIRPTTAGFYYVRVANSDAVAGQTIHIMVIESTLFSPWYYVVASLGYDGYVEIRNNTGQATTVTLRGYSNTGAIAGSSTFTVAGNGTTLVAMSTIVPDGSAGSASLTYQGQPGSFSANITTLSGATGLSFDAPFTLRMHWGTF
jgi:hypothetical protein